MAILSCHVSIKLPPKISDGQEIQSGTIRVRPKPRGGIRIMPVGMPEREEPMEVDLPPAPSQDETSPSRRVAFRGRLARH